jgi:periplasmic divalent cation tolerance protein
MKPDGAPAYLVLLVTTSNSEESHRIAAELLNKRKAACVNIMPEVNSLFWWEGELDSAHENLLIIKTRASLLNEIVTLVSQIHSYDVPEIIALPIVGGNQDYLDWVGREVE